jgi:hypothetical protein
MDGLDWEEGDGEVAGRMAGGMRAGRLCYLAVRSVIEAVRFFSFQLNGVAG